MPVDRAPRAPVTAGIAIANVPVVLPAILQRGTETFATCNRIDSAVGLWSVDMRGALGVRNESGIVNGQTARAARSNSELITSLRVAIITRLVNAPCERRRERFYRDSIARTDRSRHLRRVVAAHQA